MMYTTLQKNNRGFSLVEVLVAITILLMVMVGPMRMVSRANTSTSFATDQVTAFFLAQEGLELVQARLNYRMLGDFKDVVLDDTAQPNPWATFKTDLSACLSPNTCGVYATATTATSPFTAAVVNCASDPSYCLLYKRGGTGLRDRFTHTVSTNEPSPFTRKVQIQVVGSGSSVQGAWATSTVTWRSAGFIANQKVELVTYFTNIYGTP